MSMSQGVSLALTSFQIYLEEVSLLARGYSIGANLSVQGVFDLESAFYLRSSECARGRAWTMPIQVSENTYSVLTRSKPV